MTQSSSDEPEAVEGTDNFDRIASMFSPGTPDVGIGGIDVLRSTITAEEVDQSSAGRTLHWHISALPSEDQTCPVVLLGDLASSMDGWFVGVTVTMFLVFRDGYPLPDPLDAAGFNDVADTLGPWASNVLYDVAAMTARQLIASSVQCRVKIPVRTPKAHIAGVSFSEDSP